VDEVIYLTDYRTASSTNVELMDDILFPQKVHWFPETYARAKSGLFYPPHKVADKVLDPQLIESLKERPCKTAFILAAGNGAFAGLGPLKRPETRLTYEYRFLPLTLTQVYAGRIAQALGHVEHIVTDSSACASSLKVMMDVQTLIEMYRFDRVVVLSVEDGVSNLVLEFFGETKASLSWKEEQEGIMPSAFDEVNRGFRIGQGSVFAVFESDRVVKDAKAMLLGAYSASEDSTNAIGQREDGQGFIRAMEGAMSQAMVDKVSIVKTHGTGTVSNNKAERAALETKLKDFVATSYKAKIGHTMGSSGLLETCLLLDDMERGIVPGIANRTNKDDRFLSQDVPVPGKTIWSLAAGMGNIYSAAVLSTGF
jgi:3-oxoacyl-(acyl-carrier-protein) synthase